MLGADPPPPPPPAEDAPPPITVPGRPQNVAATAGDKTATITWRRAPDGGAAITKYVIEGGGQSITVGGQPALGRHHGPDQRADLYVHRARGQQIGAGPKAKSPPVTPTADVPDAPTSVTATAKADGTVDVTWPAANGQGRRILSYTVTSITAGVQAPIGSVTGTTMTIAAGSLEYGTQVAFTVVAVNDRNAPARPRR